MKKVLVTGGAGFIGSHLSRELRERGYRVTILDDLSTGKKENIRGLLDNAGDVQFVQDSILNSVLLLKLMAGVDYVFHLAAVASVPASIRDPLASHAVNLTGTLNVLQAAVTSRVRKVVLFSSAAVYGDTPVMPQREDMLPMPLSPYAVTKLAGEYYCDVFKKAYRLDTVSLRFFNVYGPRQDPNSQYAAAIPKFITKVLSGQAPVIFGDGGQTRDFIFVRDAAAAAILAAESDAAGVYNVGMGQTVTVNELVRLILDINGKKLEPIYQAARPGDILHSRADTSRLRALGFQPGFNLEKGLRETVDFFSGIPAGSPTTPEAR
ncbi:MAG: SDR family oxidoreductase [Dehalococcoidales bacterium]|jgi:UDP-glucose 4-epimerase